MNKTTKIVLGSILIAAAIGMYIYNNKKDTTVASSPCANGLKPCENGSGKCYDPNLHYNGDPCAAAVVTPNKGGVSEGITKSEINSTGLITK